MWGMTGGGEWGNAKAQGRNEKGIPAYAGMTGRVRVGRDGVRGMTGGGGMGERKDARTQWKGDSRLRG